MGLRVYAAAAAAIPVVVPGLYLLYLHLQTSRSDTLSGASTTLSATAKTSDGGPQLPASLPEEIRANPDQWIVSWERAVSAPLRVSSLGLGSADDGPDASQRPSALLRKYTQAAHIAFSWTPQAFLIRSLIADEKARATFTLPVLSQILLRSGDILNGVYQIIAYEGKGADFPGHPERVELALVAPANYKGPVVDGRLVAAVEKSGEEGSVVLVNETWFWRKVDGGKPTMLESGGGKFFHGILAKYLLAVGTKAVLANQ